MLSKNQIKEIQSLHLKKQRDDQRLFIVEGVKSVTEVLLQKREIVSSVYATKDFLYIHDDQLRQLNINFFEVEHLQSIFFADTSFFNV